MSIIKYFGEFQEALDKEDGYRVSTLLSIHRTLPEKLSLNGLEFKISKHISPSWSELVHLHLRVLEEIKNGSFIEASTLQNSLVQSFLQVFSNLSRWSLPILYSLNKDLRFLSIQADEVLKSQGEKTGKLEDACRTMNRAFSYCVTDRLSPMDVSRKWGTYAIANMLLKTYFRLSSTNLCTTMLRSLSAAELPDLSLYPKADQVTFKYYTGMLSFLNEQYSKARSDLSFCLTKSAHVQCVGAHPDKNKILILNYLVSIQLLSGVLPSSTMFEEYPEIQFVYKDFTLAIKQGNLHLFDSAFQSLQNELISRGTWLTIERARSMVIRTLFRKIWLIMDKSPRIPFSAFKKGLQVSSQSSNIDMEQVECFLAMAIDSGHMKGYLSHEKQTVVLSKGNAFPK